MKLVQKIDFKDLELKSAPSFEGKSLGDIINSLLPYIFQIAGFVLLAYLVYGGYQILTSQGDPKKMEVGREKITYAIIGFLVVFSTFWVIQLVARILNIQKIIEIFG